jgi:hypothetical protein
VVTTANDETVHAIANDISCIDAVAVSEQDAFHCCETMTESASDVASGRDRRFL